jgi:biopolymer transport protein ExbD
MAAASNDAPITSINVTPFVDVVLVLLVIFMATSGYIVNPAIEVDLPEAASAGETVESSIALVLSSRGELYLNGNPASEDEIARHCRSASAAHPAIVASIAADGASRHARVVSLIDLVKRNGVQSFALNIDRPEIPAAGK